MSIQATEISDETNQSTIEELTHAGQGLHSKVQQLQKKKISNTHQDFTAPDVVTSIVDSVSLFSNFFEVVTVGNQICTQSGERTFDEANNIIPLIINVIKDNAAQSRENEKLLFQLYAASHDGKLILPSWFSAIQSTVKLEANTTQLPAAGDYARVARTTSVGKILAECDGLQNVYLSLRGEKAGGLGKGGPGGSKTEAALQEWQDAQNKLGQKLIELRVNPAKTQTCIDRTSFHLSLNTETIDTLVAYFKKLGSFIVELTKVELTKEDEDHLPSTTELSEIVPRLESSSNSRLAGFELNVLPDLSSISKEALRGDLPQILEAYTSLRELVFQAYNLHAKSTSPADPTLRAIHRQSGKTLAESLNSILPSNSDTTIISLKKRNEPSLQKSLRSLLFSKVIQGSEQHNASLFIAQRENVIFLPEAMRAIIDGDEHSVEQLQSGGSQFQNFVGFGLELRDIIDNGKRRDLAEFLDNALQKGASEEKRIHTPYEEKIAIFIGFAAVTEDPAIMRLLKAQLRNKELLPTLVEKLSKDIAGEASSHGQFIEEQRILLERRFSPTLDDYWGQNKLKEDFRRAVSDHLTLLENPKIWEGLESRTVFKNGHLLVGKPGVGKGYFVSCLANDFNLPVETVTREQLENCLRTKKENQKGKESEQILETELESAYASFLDTRIQAVRNKMKIFGSIASILFIDEMEAEFLNRDPATGDRTELTRTNVMLRVIEKKISENPDIIFMGATNYIAHVDPAAYRVGRFGIPWVIDHPQKDDVEEILAGSFDQLSIDYDTAKESALYKEFAERCAGLTPLTISQLINNSICILRVRESDPIEELNDEVLKELISRVKDSEMRFKARDEALGSNTSRTDMKDIQPSL